ncbi:DUF2157 domain-containing protein [Pseudomonas sp. TTU2014-080ASC]|uniref:DUF2157 domain-containing protein n=1 Tax=Pseudomonas sp. TTU2014-080ASC TaxID=1729724 RepID=UPI00071844D6|nr:DUF2157 domain-containing protein [Pseudomonas sp. TTU2014-080ASC]KRW61893.1 hypothetical protein AO726_00185 [Pseudomonas sp. TTU2014-080ASC]
MATVSRSDAQKRADEIGIFNRELGRLEGEGVLHLSDQQRSNLHRYQEQLLNRYLEAFDIDRDRQTRQLSLGMRIASLLGALALAASVFFLFQQFWADFTPTTQVVVLVATSLATCCLTFVLQRLDGTGYFSKLAALVAFTSFVLNLVLLGDIFNIEPSAEAFLPWAAYGLLLAYGCNSRLLLILGVGCAGIFAASWLATLGGVAWDDLAELPESFMLPGVVIFALSFVLRQRQFDGFAEVYRAIGMLGVLIPVLCLSYWGQGSVLPLSADTVEVLYQFIGFALAVVLIYLGIRRDWPEVINLSVGYFVLFLFMKMVDWFWDYLPSYLFFLMVGAFAVAVLLVLRRLRYRNGFRNGGV